MITLTATPMMAIRLGRLGENERLRVAFDVTALQAELPGASFTIINQGPGDATAYPCPGVTVDDGTLYWPITSAELKQVGRGRCELIVTVGDVVAKSIIYGTEILEALDGSGEAPEPWDGWLPEFAGMVADAQEAASEAAESVEHYPTITDGVWMVWDAQSGAYVSTGVEATGPKGDPGTPGSPGPKGDPGQPGQPGEPGEDGVSPTAIVTQTATGATITVTDAEGTTTAEIANGKDGDPGAPGDPGTPGVSPTVTVTDITGGHRITITDADGAHSFDVMDGDAADAPVQSVNGQTGAVVLDAADVGAGTYSKPSGGIPASDLAAGVIPTVPVQDVQVNGVSVLNDGVANVPLASDSAYGTVKTTTVYASGLALDPSGYLKISPAYESELKTGTSLVRPVVASNQHVSTFYGLAKAAGDTTQSSSSNTVGTYTDAAKVAIQKMLGIYEAPWEIINEGSFDTQTETVCKITVDSLGQSFELTDLKLLMWVPKHDAQTIISGYWNIYFYNSNTRIRGFALAGSSSTTVDVQSTRCGYIELVRNNGLAEVRSVASTTANGAGGLRLSTYFDASGTAYYPLMLSDVTVDEIRILSVTGLLNYRLYGKRKWN